MQKLINVLILSLILTSISSVSRSEIPLKIPKNAKLTTDFEKFPTIVEVDGEFFMGLLISENQFDLFIEDKINLTKLQKQIHIYEKFDLSLEENFNKYNNITTNKLQEIEKIMNKPKYETFWDVNKNWITFTLGIIVGVGIYKLATL